MMDLKQQNLNPWDLWNASQPHFCHGMSLSFGIFEILFR